MCECNKIEIEKVSELKKTVKTFIKGLVRSKLFVNSENVIKLCITKESVKEEKDTNRYITVKAIGANNGVVANLCAEVSTRVYNKFDAEIFEPIGKQLAKAKNPISLEIKY